MKDIFLVLKMLFVPKDRSKKLWLLAVCLTMLIGSFVLDKTLIWFRAINVNNRNYSIYSVNTLYPKNIEPSFKPIFESNMESLYYWPGQYSYKDDVIVYIEDSLPHFKKIFDQYNFSDVYGFLSYLQSQQDLRTEYEVLKIYVHSPFLTKEDNYNLSMYLMYLNKYYVSPVEGLLEQQRIGDAGILISKAYSRIKLVDFDPLYFSYRYSDEVNHILLLNAVLANPAKNLLSNDDFIRIVYLIYNLNQLLSDEGDKILNRINADSELVDFKSYLFGLRLFKDKEYIKAFDKFIMLKNSQNKFLSQLAVLMCTRCVVWDFIKTGYSNKDIHIKKIESLKSSIIETNFLSDYNLYLDFIKNHKKYTSD